MEQKLTEAKKQALKDMRAQGVRYLNAFDHAVREGFYQNPGFKRGWHKAIYMLIALCVLSCVPRSRPHNQTRTSYDSAQVQNHNDAKVMKYMMDTYGWTRQKAQDFVVLSDSVFMAIYYGPDSEDKSCFVMDFTTNKDEYYINRTYKPNIFWITTQSNQRSFEMSSEQLSAFLSNLIREEQLLHVEMY